MLALCLLYLTVNGVNTMEPDERHSLAGVFFGGAMYNEYFRKFWMLANQRKIVGTIDIEFTVKDCGFNQDRNPLERLNDDVLLTPLNLMLKPPVICVPIVIVYIALPSHSLHKPIFIYPYNCNYSLESHSHCHIKFPEKIGNSGNFLSGFFGKSGSDFCRDSREIGNREFGIPHPNCEPLLFLSFINVNDYY
jgi:hypothetical protein